MNGKKAGNYDDKLTTLQARINDYEKSVGKFYYWGDMTDLTECGFMCVTWRFTVLQNSASNVDFAPNMMMFLTLIIVPVMVRRQKFN